MTDRIWFKAKTYGWGWTPASWQGWAVTIADLVFVLGWGVYLATHPALARRPDFLLIALAPIVAAALILIVICWLKGERPRWRWGN
jgi:peptidoglycan/LPS O-acetylase OafA/YrhL